MNKNKRIIISLLVVISLILIVSIGTYAYLMAITEEGEVGTGSGKLDINYVGPTDESLTGNIISSDSREYGIKATASASLKSGSEAALFNMYITPNVIDGLNISAFKWEVEGYRGGTMIPGCSGKGTFSGATANTRINMVSGCPLSDAVTTFNIYIWLNGNEITDAISNAAFSAKIGANSTPITGEF